MRHQQGITDLAKWNPPQRIHQGVDGDDIVEKLSPCMHVMMVDKAGNTVPLMLSNGIANRDANDPYRIQVLAEKVAAGMIPVGRCPLGAFESLKHLPQSVREDDGGRPRRSARQRQERRPGHSMHRQR